MANFNIILHPYQNNYLFNTIYLINFFESTLYNIKVINLSLMTATSDKDFFATQIAQKGAEDPE